MQIYYHKRQKVTSNKGVYMMNEQYNSISKALKVNLLAAGKFQYKSTSYKMQNLYIKSLDISGRVPDLTAGRYIDQPRR